MSLACHYVDPKDEVDTGWGWGGLKGLLLLALLGTAATTQEMRTPVKGPFAWTKWQDRVYLASGRGQMRPLSATCREEEDDGTPSEGCCEAVRKCRRWEYLAHKPVVSGSYV